MSPAQNCSRLPADPEGTGPKRAGLTPRAYDKLFFKRSNHQCFDRLNTIFCESAHNIPSLTVGVRQVAEVISVQTNPDREGGDVVMTWLRYFSCGRGTSAIYAVRELGD